MLFICYVQSFAGSSISIIKVTYPRKNSMSGDAGGEPLRNKKCGLDVNFQRDHSTPSRSGEEPKTYKRAHSDQ